MHVYLIDYEQSFLTTCTYCLVENIGKKIMEKQNLGCWFI